MPPLSVLDLSPVVAGSTEAQALHDTVTLAIEAERLGFHRYWLAEHHGGAMVASSSPEIMIGQVAGATSRIRVGSGGVMLPNHTPLHVAEQFKVLEALHPGRIDLGIGRAPGTDQLTAYALRRDAEKMDADDFPSQLGELLAFAGARPWPANHPFRQVRAAPTDVPLPPVYLLGSSAFSAQVAAANGFGFAFAAHIAPDVAVDVLRLYRERFRPSEEFPEPYAILGHAVVCAADDETAQRLAAPARVAFRRLRAGSPAPIPTVEEALAEERARPASQAPASTGAERVIVGAPETVRDRLDELLSRSEADELIAVTTMHGLEDRMRSYALLAEAFHLTAAPASRT
jgi:luciferase family oxidoreductase group 1